MKYFPIFVSVDQRRIVVSGGGEVALAKLRLLLKTTAKIEVYCETPIHEVVMLGQSGRIDLVLRALGAGDAAGALLVYVADEDREDAAKSASVARLDNVLVNVVDNLEASAFLTPAIVDRDPVTIAIGTEGAAPVLARSIKASLEEQLPAGLGVLARIGKAFRPKAARLGLGLAQRAFWSDFYFKRGPELLGAAPNRIEDALEDLLDEHKKGKPRSGQVAFVGAGPGDPELLTLKARKALHEADVIIYDRLVSEPILELCRREATMISVGKEGFGPSVSQGEINALLVEHGRNGSQVVRLKGGDPTVFGRLDEEIEALEEFDISWHIVPGITAASAGIAAIGQSLTKRGRNHGARLITAHDMAGFVDQDWRAIAHSGEVSAVYMGKRAARYVQGRLLMHGANTSMPISVVENASRPDERIVSTTLGRLEADLVAADLTGPAIMLIGIAPRVVERMAKSEVAI